MSPAAGDRLVDIAAVEIIGTQITGQVFQSYLNPQRDVPLEVQKVHGLSTEFLRDKPLFAHIVDAFLQFIGDAPLIIHNAEFDMAFINAELQRAGREQLPMSRAIDTVRMAKRQYPGQRASLDVLCKRFEINLEARAEFHGARVDAELLAQVYLILMRGEQDRSVLMDQQPMMQSDLSLYAQRTPRTLAVVRASDEEKAQHQALLKTLKNPRWPVSA